MITEDFCSFEVASLLKEKGFSEKTIPFYNDDGSFCSRIGNVCQPFDWNHDKFVFFSAPTHQMAVKWLRKKNIRICPDYSDVDGKWFTMIGTKKKRTYSGYYDIYEEAIEAALKYSLEKLL